MDHEEWEVIYTDSDRQMLQSQSEIKEIRSHIKSNRLLIKNLFLEISDIMNDRNITLIKSHHFQDFFILYSDKYLSELCRYFNIESLPNFNQEVEKEIIRLENICLANNNDYMTDIKEISLKFYILVKKLIEFDISEEQSNQIILLFFPLIISVIFE